jgi:hypothetical protein
VSRNPLPPHRRRFTLSQHCLIGWVALHLAGLHAAILLLEQPLIAKPPAPSARLYMRMLEGANR